MSKYPALSFFRGIYSVLGYLVIVFGVLGSIFILMFQDGFLVGIVGIAISIFAGASILVTAELLAVIMDIENHLLTIRLNQSSNQLTPQKPTSARVPAPSVYSNNRSSTSKLGKFDPPSG